MKTKLSTSPLVRRLKSFSNDDLKELGEDRKHKMEAKKQGIPKAARKFTTKKLAE